MTIWMDLIMWVFEFFLFASRKYQEITDFDLHLRQGRDRSVPRAPVAPPVKSEIEIQRENLFLAIRENNLAEVKQIIETNKGWFRINEPLLGYNWTVLQLACMDLRADMVSYLLRLPGANANYFNMNCTALHCVCMAENVDSTIEPLVLQIVKCLVEFKADLNRPNVSGETPFMLAIRNGYDNVVDFMIGTRKIAMELADRAQNTAIFYAVQYNRLHVVKRLVELGVNVELQNQDGSTPCQLAEEMGNPEIIELLPIIEKRLVPSKYTSITSYRDVLPTAFKNRSVWVISFVAKNSNNGGFLFE